jgi:1-acyl-sn-glycerol-3-phosphate acyltransferase
MEDPDDGEADTGVTVEFSREELGGASLPAAPDRGPDQLPGLEPERRITDWGRSERIEGFVDRTVYDFLYRYWFRVELEGVDNVPDTGGALLVANHSGAVPSDGAMIGKALREEHPRRRPLYIATERRFGGMPGVGMLVTKLGGVAAHPANLHRLLFDEGELALLFPEGQAGAQKSLRDRYRLRAFPNAEFVTVAIRARVPIVPIALIGAEEATPVFGRLGAMRGPLRRLGRLPLVPLSAGAPLPAKVRIRFLEPVGTDELEPESWRDRGLIQSLAEDTRALIQENLLEMVGQRRSVWFG